ncbi:phosphosulfolactate synthase [Gorillibacterium sp. sgz5001074]|uniref:phosphosulfolactate synthase n=1 Tax=Gorillibacterium sp. sgz5001074 TaxID=3446695 RepID=UPI003F67BF73
MEPTTPAVWHPALQDPTASRSPKPRASGITMVIDKGLGLHAYADLLDTATSYIDIVKFGFGTAPLYPPELLKRKIELARERGITVIPGGTFLEVAVAHGLTDAFFEMVVKLGFTGVEVSDGTIEMDPALRRSLIRTAAENGFKVYTEYGKKGWGSRVEVQELIDTVISDIEHGAELVTIEARESGAGVGIFDEKGECRDDEVQAVLDQVPGPHLLLWEAPQKQQQVHLIQMLGPDVNLGNIAPQDIFALEALRRGLRSDTFYLKKKS